MHILYTGCAKIKKKFLHRKAKPNRRLALTLLLAEFFISQPKPPAVPMSITLQQLLLYGKYAERISYSDV